LKQSQIVGAAAIAHKQTPTYRMRDMQSLVSFWLLGYTHSMLVYAFDMAFANLDAWSRETPAPKAPRIAIKNGAIDRDEFGNGKGGVRDAYVEVPTASYFTTPGPGTCRELGYDVGYDWQKLETLYGNYSNYAMKLNASPDHW